jgi:glycosyltransferase involved in cell wall biosynthesis
MTQAPAAPDTPEVSVVIPTCNRRDLLQKCVEALARQTHPRFEVIVVDDCSTDDTPRFLEAFAAAHPHLVLRRLRNERQSGANVARNRGIRAARGEFIALIDSDSIAEPDWLERLVRGFTHPAVAAVVGRVVDPPPRNIYDLTYGGNNRIPGEGRAIRLVGCNMAVRRGPLTHFMMDEDPRLLAKMRGNLPDVTTADEDGLYLLLDAAGYEQRVVPDAVVLHEHYYTRRSFFRQAYKGGGTAAYLVAKYGLHTRIDILPFLLAYGSLPLLLVDLRLALVPAFFFAGACLALAYNEVLRKGKSLLQLVRIFPVLLAYYHVRVWGYLAESLRIRLGRREVRRVDLRAVPRMAGSAGPS